MSDKVIDVYLGVMDEEVNTVLYGLLDKEMQKVVAVRRPIVMIERGHVDPAGPLLEWPISRYKTGIKAVKYAGAQLAGQGGVDASVEGILACAMSVFLQQENDAEAQLKEANVTVLRAIDVHAMVSPHSGEKLRVPLTGNGPQLSVIRFNVGDADTTLPPIIVLRAPEMGLQPNLMSPYMEFILMMISALSSQLAHAARDDEEWPLRITSFGAQGGASSSKSPGTMSYICASLSVGYEYDNGAASPLIALCSLGGVYTFKSSSPPQGLPLAAEGPASMPAVARWTFADAPIFQTDPRAFARHLYGLVVQGTDNVIVPDPFFIEIATDLLKACTGLPASSGDIFTHAPAAEVLVALTDTAKLALRKWADANRQPSHDVMAALLAFVDVLADRADFAIDATKMKVWLRPGGKWHGIASHSIQDVPPETTFCDTVVGRAFYKSSNLIALQARTAGVLH